MRDLKPAVRVSNLSAEYRDPRGTLHVLKNISFSIEQGQFICLLGPSGAGKSTLLRILAGLLPVQRGQVYINERLIDGPHADVGMVFQDANLMPWRTAIQNVALPLEVTGSSKLTASGQAKKMVSIVGLRGFENSLPSSLSGGMAQRVAIGRALVQKPDLLLMDEPFGSLDAITRERMGEELLRIWSRQQKTVLLVTHDIAEAVYLADRVLVLSERPARIKLDLQVNLARPRKPGVRYTKAFGKLAAKLRGAIE